MSKSLVAYFSWTGHTRQVAEAVAAALGADVEEICEARMRSGWIDYFGAAWEVLRGKLVPIGPSKTDVATYDLVVLGTPVWAGHMSSPLFAYITREHANFAKIAVLCTEGGASGEKVIAQIAELCAKEPVATLIVKEREISSGAWRHKVAEFVKALQSA